MNLYAYAGNNPIAYSDPYGLCPLCAAIQLWNGDYTDPANSKKINQLAPALQTPARQVVNRAAMTGHPIHITEGLRTEARQNELYGKGRTADQLSAKGVDPSLAKPGEAKVTNAANDESAHTQGRAFDIAKNGDRPYAGSFAEIGAIGVGAGLVWGGNFTSIKDYVHFELPKDH